MNEAKRKDSPLLKNAAFNRRRFLQTTVATATIASLPGSTFSAQHEDLPPGRPTPQQALATLTKGHARFMQGKTGADDLSSHRAELAKGQAPIAAILGCADSRVVPDFLYDQPSGRLFVVRVAGNFVTNDGQASLEYGVAVLNIPLIVVLGHSGCGAVDAAVKVVKEDAKLPGKLPGLAEAIVPAVKATLQKPGNLLDNAIAENVKRNVEILRKAGPIIGPAAKSGKIEIVGGVYNISTGQVQMLS